MKYLIFYLFPFFVCYSQMEYPKDYFGSPLDIPIVLAGTFAELRSNHFHSGLDIKTQGKSGLNIYAAAEGYVSRIKISHFGYGKALYITHPNGYVSVYAHLKEFSPTIEKYIKECQYEKETFEVEMFPTPKELLVSKGEVVAISGNTGSSSGPHLHYEIRDNAERPINPMLFGVSVPDSKAPRVQGIFAYPLGQNAHINDSSQRIELRLIPTKNGDFSTENINAHGDIGFGVVSYDQQDMAYNKNGLSNIQTFLNGNKSLEIDFKRFSFDETKHLNRLIDYQYFKDEKSRIQKLFVESNNPLSLYKDVSANGRLKIRDSSSTVYKIKLSDYAGNESWISIPIQGKRNDSIKAPMKSGNIDIIADRVTTLEDGNYKVFVPSNSFYDDEKISFEVKSDTLFLHKDVIPLKKSFTIEYNIGSYSEPDKDKLYIAKLFGYYQNPSHITTRRKGDILTARSSSFGTFTLESDTINPTISAVNFQDKKWISKLNNLQLKIEDKDSGISNYRATVNGKWILMEYDYKKKTLTHNIGDGIITDTENKLKVIVTDNVGNSSTFEATFFRKQ